MTGEFGVKQWPLLFVLSSSSLAKRFAGAVKDDGVYRHTLIYGRHEEAGRKTGSHI